MNKLIKQIRLRAENEQTRTDNCDVIVPKLGSKYSYGEVDEFEYRCAPSYGNLVITPNAPDVGVIRQ